MLNYPNCAAFINGMRRALPVSEAVSVRVNDILIRVMTNSCTVRNILVRYYREFITQDAGTADILVTVHTENPRQWEMPWTVQMPEVGKTRIQEEYFDYPDGRLIHRPTSTLLFAMTGESNLVLGPCESHADQVVDFINSRYVEYLINEGALLGHASAICGHGRGLAIAGNHGMGKSPLALYAVRLGAEFMGNDRICLRRGTPLICQGIPRQPRISQRIAATAPSLNAILPPDLNVASNTDALMAHALVDSFDSLKELEKRYNVFLDECFGLGHFTLTAPLNALVFLQWQPNAGALQLVPLKGQDLREALGSFIKQPGLFYLPRAGGPESSDAHTYYEALQNCECVALTGTVDFEAAARICVDFLEKGTFAGA